MYMCVYMYVCMYVYTYIHMYTSADDNCDYNRLIYPHLL